MKELDFLKKTHDITLDFSNVIRFDKKHPYHFNLLALQGSMIELSSCIIILLEHNGKAAIPSIFRTILETFVELKNLADSPKYGYYMEVAHNKQWLHLLASAKKGNSFLSKIANEIDLDKQIQEYEQKIKGLENKGYSQLTISKRFQMAGMENEDDSLYNFLSCDAHSNIRSLISRHAEITEEDYKVVYYRGEPVESFLTYIDSTVRLLVNSAILVHTVFETDKVEELNNLLAEYNDIYSGP
jgi:hypothetical protein